MKCLNFLMAYIILVIGCILFPTISDCQVTQTITTTGNNTFIVPSGVNSLMVECWGAGGAGGGCTSTSYATGGGGGGGSYSKLNNIQVVSNASYAVIVGAGGVAVSAGVGGTGGFSSFGNFLTASGGSGGAVNGFSINGMGADNSLGATFDGGAGGTGTATIRAAGTSGAGGGGAGSLGSGGNAIDGTSGAGGSGGGGAGAAGRSTTGGGYAGSAPGGGGSGGRNANVGSVQSGGNGGNGMVKITYNCPVYNIASISALPTCTGNSTTITVNGIPDMLPAGMYIVTYNISSPNAMTGATATMNVSSNGTGTFLTNVIAVAGNNTITITNIKSGSGTGCSSVISGRTTIFTSTAQPTPFVEFTQGLLDTVSNISVCGFVGGGGQNDMDIESGNPGGASTIQWQVSLDRGNTWSNAPGPTTNSTQFVLNPLYCFYESFAGTYYFRAIVTNGSCVGISNKIRLTVTGISNLNAGVVGNNQNFCYGGDPSLLTSVSAPTGVTGSYTYQWQVSTDSINFNMIAGATQISYNPPAISQTMYYRRITVSGGCRAFTNNITAQITTAVPPAPSVITGYATVCAGKPGFSYSVLPMNAVNGYTWSVPSGWSVSAGSGTNTVTITSGAAGQNGEISVYASNVCGAGIPSILAVSATNGSSAAVILGDTMVCDGSSANLRVMITGGAAPYELVFSNGSINTTISNYLSGNPIIVTPLSTSTYSIVRVNSVGGCSGTSLQGTATVSIATPGTWLGTVDNDWNNAQNWCGGVPIQSTNVVVPSNRPNTPILSSASAAVNNITISNGTQVIVNRQTLKISGNIIANGNLNALDGTIELTGHSVAQNFRGSMLPHKKIKNLRISNPSGVNLIGSDDTLKLTGILDFGASNCLLNTNGNLTLHSSATGTASVADMTFRGMYVGNRIIGNVNYEKYIPLQTKAWRLLAAPATGQSIKSAWQGGNSALSNSLNPGYGTIITSNLQGAATTLGFDLLSPAGASMKVYNNATENWDGVSSTNNIIDNPKGYMIFIRGDRSVTSFNQPATPTIMRMSGVLYTPQDNPPPTVFVNAEKYETVGNPYACTIDFGLVGKTGGIQDVFYLWDPGLTNTQYSAYGLGGFQTIVNNGYGYEIIPGGGSYGDVYTGIPSGQAFFVRASGTGGVIQFDENCKITESIQVMRASRANTVKSIKMKYSVISNGNPVLLDGTMVSFNEDYANELDAKDISKIGNNISENIGLLRSNKRLALERRAPITSPDTVYLSLNAQKKVTYKLDIIPAGWNQNMVNAWLVDKYLNITIPVNLDSTQSYSYSVDNNPESAASDRFYLKFQPVITSFASKVSKTRSFPEFSVEKKTRGSATFGPNPLIGNRVFFNFEGWKPGKYELMFSNGLGQIIDRKELNLIAANSKDELAVPSQMPAGQYSLSIYQKGICVWSEALQIK